jgi:hypothetical protein
MDANASNPDAKPKAVLAYQGTLSSADEGGVEIVLAAASPVPPMLIIAAALLIISLGLWVILSLSTFIGALAIAFFVILYWQLVREFLNLARYGWLPLRVHVGSDELSIQCPRWTGLRWRTLRRGETDWVRVAAKGRSITGAASS